MRPKRFCLTYYHEIKLYSTLHTQFRLSHIKCNWKLFILISINFAYSDSTSDAQDKKQKGLNSLKQNYLMQHNRSYG